MRDLEIRGAGDILGTRQHGHIAAVGFHLYTSLLAEAVRRLRIEKGGQLISLPPSLNVQLNPVNVELPLTSNIPADYVPDQNSRLGLYRRMADMRTFNELDALEEEFSDRFGPPPEMVKNLFYQLKIKLLAEKASLASITVENRQLALRFHEETIPNWIPSVLPDVRIGKTALWIRYENLDDWSEDLIDIINRLIDLHPEQVNTETFQQEANYFLE